MWILRDLAVIHIVTIPADLAVFVELATSISPILVYFLRFATGQQIAEIIGNPNDFQHMRREVSRGLFETLVAVCIAYYQRVTKRVNGKMK